MTKVFIGGSRHVSRLSPQLLSRIDNITSRQFPIVIGDANGADKAVQAYLHSVEYPNVEVFCTEGICRNNIGNWRVRSVPAGTRERNAEFYSAKDRVMSCEADVGLMVWDGKSVGTLVNVMRLIGLQKKVVIYIVPDKQFMELHSMDDWRGLLESCNPAVRRKVQQRAAREMSSDVAAAQTLFSAL
jgi:adenine-specific DNA-methyltransferase